MKLKYFSLIILAFFALVLMLKDAEHTLIRK